MKRFLSLALCLALIGCSPSQVVATLQAVVVATEAAVAALSASGVVIPSSVMAYLQAVNTATGCASTEIASTDTDAQKAVKIAACFTSAVKPVVPAGTPALIVGVIQSVDAAVAAFLANYHVQVAIVPRALQPANVAPNDPWYPAGASGFLPPGAPNKATKLSKMDKKTLDKINAKTSANAVELEKLKPRVK